jgi:hypothetical protein
VKRKIVNGISLLEPTDSWWMLAWLLQYMCWMKLWRNCGNIWFNECAIVLRVVEVPEIAACPGGTLNGLKHPIMVRRLWKRAMSLANSNGAACCKQNEHSLFIDCARWPGVRIFRDVRMCRYSGPTTAAAIACHWQWCEHGLLRVMCVTHQRNNGMNIGKNECDRCARVRYTKSAVFWVE